MSTTSSDKHDHHQNDDTNKENMQKLEQEYKKDAEAKKVLREKNLLAHSKRPPDSFFQSLESNVKKNSAFVKRIKTFAELRNEQKVNMVSELEKLNLRRYVSEIVQAIATILAEQESPTEQQVKPMNDSTDINILVSLCCKFHQLYEDFTISVIKPILKAVFKTESGVTVPNPASSISLALNTSKLCLFLLTELFILGVFKEDYSSVYSLLKTITKEGSKHPYKVSCIVEQFLKRYGEEICGLKDLKLSPDNEEDILRRKYKPFISEDDKVIPTQDQQKFKELIIGHFDHLCQVLYNDHLELKRRETEKHNELLGIKNTGSERDTSENTGKKYEELRKNWFQLYNIAKSLSTMIEKEMPDNLKEGLSRMEQMSQSEQFSQYFNTVVNHSGVSTHGNNNQMDQQKPNLLSGVPLINSSLLCQVDERDLLYDDEETREFYECIPEINSLINSSSEITGSITQTDGSSAYMDKLLEELPNCCSQTLINLWVVKFVFSQCAANKAYRMKLTKALFGVKRTSLELLPHYSRLVCILAEQYKDICQFLQQELIKQFNKLFQEKDQIKIETKIKNIRFLGELCKFKLLPARSIIIEQCLEKLLNDFTHHNIDVCCACFEVCGRFLLVKKETHIYARTLLEKMMRLREIKILDPKYDVMVENAYYEASKPFLSQSTHTAFERSEDEGNISGSAHDSNPLHKYIHHLLYNELSKNNSGKILKQLRKLPWNDQGGKAMYEIILNAIRNVKSSRFSNVHLVASVVSGLSKHHEFVGIAVIDRLVEDIRLGLSNPLTQSLQKRILDIKFLGELYNYQLLDSPLIFDVLFTIIFYRIDLNYANIIASRNNPSIPPEILTDDNEMDFAFRLRLVCALLDTIAPYLEDNAGTRRRMDRFLLYLQRFVLSTQKKLPVDIEYLLADTLEAVRPKLKWPKSLEEAHAKIERIEKNNPQSVTTLPTYDTIWPISRTAVNTDTNTEYAYDGDNDEKSNNFGPQSPSIPKKSVEDSEFDKELDALINESIHENSITQRPTLLKLTDPSKIMNSHRIQPSPPSNQGSTETTEEQAPCDIPTVKYKLLMRRGKQKTKDIEIPADSKIVQNPLNNIHFPPLSETSNIMVLKK